MAEIASAYVSLIPSMKGAQGKISRELDGVAGSAGKSSGRRMGSGMAAGVAGMATKVFAPLAAAAATVSIGGFFKDAVSQASDLNESSTKLNAIFGKSAAQVQKFAAGGAKALGQTKLAVLDASATFGTFGKAAGLSGKDLAGFSTQFAGLSTDLASFYNTSPEQAVEAIGAALRGEAEPMRQYGVLLDDATMRQQALKMGLIKTTKQALTPQQKVLAAQAVIMKQTKDAQGDFARTSGGLANQQRILAAQWSDMKTNLGTKLLPVVTKFVTFLNSGLGPGIKKVSAFLKPAVDTVKLFIGAFTGQGADVELPWMNTVIDIASSLRSVFDAVVPSVRAVFASFQSGGTGAVAAANAFRVVGQVLGTVGAFIRAQVLPAFMGIVNAVRGYITVALPIVQAFVAGMMARIQPMLPTIRAIFGAIGQIVVGVMGLIQAIIQRVTAIIGGIWSRWGSNIMNFAAKIFGSVLTIIGGALKIIQGIIKTVTSLIRGDWSGAWAGIKQIVAGAWQVIRGIVSGAMASVRAVISMAIAGIKAVWSAGWNALKSGVSSAIAGVLSFVRGIPDRIRGAIGDLSGVLLGAGRSVIEGFKRGIQEKIGEVQATLRNLTDKLPDWKGPAKRDKNILTPAGRAVIQGFIDGIKQATPKVESQLQGLTKALIRYGKNGLARSLSDENSALLRITNQRTAVADRLKAAQSKLAAALKVRDDYAASVRESFTSFGRITDGGDTADAILEKLRADVAKARDFASNLAKLSKMGLSKSAYKQIVDAGVDQGSTTAAALVAGGKGAIGQVNRLVSQMASVGASVAKQASRDMYQAGVDSALGLVKGLQSQSAALAAAAKRIANSLVKQVKKSLGIKSPSRVFAKEVGEHIPTGVIRGIDSTQGKLTARLSRMVPTPDLAVAGGGSTGAVGAGVVINGNVGWQPDEVARKIASRQRDAAALYNLQGVTA